MAKVILPGICLVQRPRRRGFPQYGRRAAECDEERSPKQDGLSLRAGSTLSWPARACTCADFSCGPSALLNPGWLSRDRQSFLTKIRLNCFTHSHRAPRWPSCWCCCWRLCDSAAVSPLLRLLQRSTLTGVQSTRTAMLAPGQFHALPTRLGKRGCRRHVKHLLRNLGSRLFFCVESRHPRAPPLIPDYSPHARDTDGRSNASLTGAKCCWILTPAYWPPPLCMLHPSPRLIHERPPRPLLSKSIHVRVDECSKTHALQPMHDAHIGDVQRILALRVGHGTTVGILGCWRRLRSSSSGP